MRKYEKIFFSETTMPKACIFGMKQFLEVPYINPANHIAGVKIGHAPGVISSHRLIVGKHKKIFSETMRPRVVFFTLCEAMFSKAPYNSCQS